MSKCKECRAEILFCKTSAGKWMPVDAAANPEGNLVMDGVDDEGYQRVAVVDLFTPSGAVRYMPHWATCPEAAEFRP